FQRVLPLPHDRDLSHDPWTMIQSLRKNGGSSGWDNLRRAVDGATYQRARVWDRTFGVTHLVAALDGRPLANADSYVRHIVAWLEAGTSTRRTLRDGTKDGAA
ncbi:hypothetical protein AB0N02_44305, partial [Streptosporangium sp. NPDC051022]